MQHIIWSSQLRAVGLTGFGGEEGVLAFALNIHFNSDGPEGWHFTRKQISRKKSTKTAANVQNELRLLRKPQWFGSLIHDLMRTNRLLVCKALPRPERVLLSSEDRKASRWQQASSTAKRQRLAEIAEEQHNPKTMHDGLWQQLRITTLSLPDCLRPGRHPR